MPVYAVAISVGAQVWPLLAFLGALLVAALIWLAVDGDAVPLKLSYRLVEAGLFGLVGSFALHESAHAIVLKRTSTVTHLALERTLWRTSVVSVGELGPRQLAATAAAGPLSCVVAGAAFWVIGSPLAWWYLSHALFLLPFFSDGRNICRGLLGHRIGVSLDAEANVDTGNDAPSAGVMEAQPTPLVDDTSLASPSS